MSETLPDTVDSPRIQARHLYWQGWRVARIAELYDIPQATVHSWKLRDGWDKASPIERVEGTIEARYVQLICKENKEGKDYKEIDLLGRQLERTARINRYSETGREADLNPAQSRGGAATRRKKPANFLDESQIEAVKHNFWNNTFDYQRDWYHAGVNHRIRNILKSRQIGATWFFAREAICDALETSKNKIFLSASRAQAYVFRSYILQLVRHAADVDLKGGKDSPLVLANGAELYFLGTNAATAQSYHGDLYLDEYFWIHRFQEFRKVASGMAMHKQWRQTYFSTPSSIAHEAYPFWTGDLFNQRRPRDQRVEIDTSHAALAGGALCADGHWRQIVTVHDAVARGCDLFDIEQLRLEYSPDEFANLLECQFVDDTESAFPLSFMQSCMVDSWDLWTDFQPFAPRPVGDDPVWLGYDPAGDNPDGDGAGLGIVAAADQPGGKHRVIEKHKLRGNDYEAQAGFIRQQLSRFNVTHIGIDTTGMGDSVAQLVEKFFPTVVRYRYTPEVKSSLVRQTQQMIRKGRLEFDSGWSDLAQSFMSIKKTMTDGGRAMTYKAGRSSATGHAELAWAVMHALGEAPIDGDMPNSGSVMEISG